MMKIYEVDNDVVGIIIYYNLMLVLRKKQNHRVQIDFGDMKERRIIQFAK